MVFGDSMADWLAYGLEQAFSDNPEIGILRRHRTSSGLIRTEVRNDPRGEYPDWPVTAKEMIAAQRPKFVVMMIGLNDRKQIREVVPQTRAKPVGPAVPDPAARELDAPEPRPEAATPLLSHRALEAPRLTSSEPTRGARPTSGASMIPLRRSRRQEYRSSGSACRHCGPVAPPPTFRS
jgi:hypothetical protein